MRIQHLLLAVSAMVLASSPAMAAATSIAIGSWEQSYSGDLIDEDGPKDVQSDLALTDSRHLEASINWATQSGWIPNIRLGAFRIETSGVNTISESETIQLLGIPIITATGSAQVSTRVNYTVWSSLFFYRWPWKGINWELGATLNYIDGSVVADVDYDNTAELSGRVDEQRKDSTETFVPTGYLSLHKPIGDRFALRASFYGATTGEDSVGQVSAFAEIAISRNWLLYGGYRAQGIDFYDETKQTGLDLQIKGPVVGLVLTLPE